jgi:DNA-binding NtrC family response regulator
MYRTQFGGLSRLPMPRRPLAPVHHNESQPAPSPVTRAPKSRLTGPTAEEARIASLKVLAMTLLEQLDSLDKQIESDSVQEFNLQDEVHRFEAAIIRCALQKTGGRQRRAARLLGVKVTTLNTKIKRLNILVSDTL